MRKKEYVLVIVFVILSFSILYFSFSSAKQPQVNPNIKTYNGFVFEKDGNLWLTKIRLQDTFAGWVRDYEILFHYTPDEVEHIKTMKNSLNQSTSPNLFLDASHIYITMDPEYPSEVVLAGVEISKIIGRVYEKEVQAATTRPDNRTDAPVITCDDLAPGIRVIDLRLGKTTEIFSEHGCIVVQGTDPEELLKAAERLSFEMLKIL